MYLSFEQYLCGSADFVICCNLQMRPAHSTQHTAHSTAAPSVKLPAGVHLSESYHYDATKNNSEVDDLQPF